MMIGRTTSPLRFPAIVALMLLVCLTTLGCISGSDSRTSDPAVAKDLGSVVAAAAQQSDRAGAARFLEVENQWRSRLQPADYGQLANDLLDIDRPISARAVLDSVERRFGGDPEIASQIERLRLRARLVENRLELSSPEIRD